MENFDTIQENNTEGEVADIENLIEQEDFDLDEVEYAEETRNTFDIQQDISSREEIITDTSNQISDLRNYLKVP